MICRLIFCQHLTGIEFYKIVLQVKGNGCPGVFQNRAQELAGQQLGGSRWCSAVQMATSG